MSDLFGEPTPKPDRGVRGEGAPVRAQQGQLWTGQRDQRGQVTLEDIEDARRAKEAKQ